MVYEDDYHRKAREKQARRRARDPDEFRRKQRTYRAESPEYMEKLKGRSAQRRRDNPPWYLWDKARRRASLGSLEFTITVEDVVIPTHCPVLGIPLVILSKRRFYDSATIDRFDNTIGYIPENIRVISARANSLKSNGTIEEFRAIIRYMKTSEVEAIKTKLKEVL